MLCMMCPAAVEILFMHYMCAAAAVPQARSTKAKARVDAYGVLVEKARDTPAADLRVDFGRVGMARLGERQLILIITYTPSLNSRGCQCEHCTRSSFIH
jgi:hypothetical protein